MHSQHQPLGTVECVVFFSHIIQNAKYRHHVLTAYNLETQFNVNRRQKQFVGHFGYKISMAYKEASMPKVNQNLATSSTANKKQTTIKKESG